MLWVGHGTTGSFMKAIQHIRVFPGGWFARNNARFNVSAQCQAGLYTANDIGGLCANAKTAETAVSASTSRYYGVIQTGEPHSKIVLHCMMQKHPLWMPRDWSVVFVK